MIGDPGEGDASQHVLRDQLIAASSQPDVRFVVVASDVVYPAGAMKDYEANFWLPFKGVTKPVYAIPGNHDWYDALEGFAATFFTPAAARTALRARSAADQYVGTTTDARIEALIAEAGRLRREYRVSTGHQQGPFFQVLTDGFALITLDTGIGRRSDPVQLAWFRAALEASRGRLTMVLLGHPLYAVGRYAAADQPDFAAIHALLREFDVTLVMAGDTHDLEYYVERPPRRAPMHHVVNGGGGAYLSLGTALAPPERMPTRDWSFYPATGSVVAKVESQTPWYKLPAWWWTRRLNGWPFSAEWLSAAFDYNSAPYFQSFLEVRVEPAERRVRLRPWGVHGRLTWRELESSASLKPPARRADELAEWVIERGR